MCSGCDKKYPIVNKKYDLCAECVFKKSHNGQSRAEVYATRSAAKEPKPKKAIYYIHKGKLRSVRIKSQTKKEKIIKEQLSELKNDIRVEAAQNNMYYCWGCGHTDHLDCSHILSVGRYKHLELDKTNINLFCRDCHRDWESGILENIAVLYTFESDLEYVKMHDFQRFTGILNDIYQYLKWNQDLDNELIRKFRNISKKYQEIVA